MSKSESPPESTSEPSRLTAIGEACALALVGAVVCAVPTAIRTSPDAGIVDGMLVGVAMLLLLLLPTALLLRRAARGFRGVVGRAPSRVLGLGLAMWAGLSVGLLLVLAAVLKAKTHHRGLGGATYGVFGAAVVVGAAVFVGRLVAIGRGLLDRGVPRGFLLAVAALLCVGPFGALVAPMLSGDEASHVSATLFDTLLVLGIGGVVLSRRLPAKLLLVARLAALPVSACLVVVGVVRVETSTIGDQIQRAGGLPATMLSGLEMWTDHDGDGVGSHFGGSDCDEGDPSRYPGAEDPVGDGWDGDCDGADGPVTLAALVREVAVSPPPPQETDELVGTASVSATAATVAASAPPSPDAGPTPRAVAKRPDIIMVTLDTVRADHTSIYGYDKDTTPALKKLAGRGVVFERAYAVGAGTQRALTPVLSGKSYARTPHSTKEWPLLREEAELLPEHLKKGGYRTAAVTSFTWLRKDRGFGQGFDELIEDPWSTRHPEREYTSDLAADAAIAAYDKLSGGDAPLFLWLHVFDAHAKYVEHGDYDFGDGAKDRYDGEIAFQDAQLARFFEKVEA
ncbi:MAG TPA: cell wall anchor protein, partial [Polyangiaceae bacterium]|nr:cell wall anchor protein [Polyangiaceae bacterium]